MDIPHPRVAEPRLELNRYFYYELHTESPIRINWDRCIVDIVFPDETVFIRIFGDKGEKFRVDETVNLACRAALSELNRNPDIRKAILGIVPAIKEDY